VARTLILVRPNSLTCLELFSAAVTNENAETNEQLDCAITVLDVPDTDAENPAISTAITPKKSEDGDAASSSFCRGNFTTEPGTYETEHLDNEGVPGLSGYHFDPIPEERPVISPGSYVGLRILEVPSQFNAIAKIVWREIGG
jgi:hypothetical protein